MIEQLTYKRPIEIVSESDSLPYYRIQNLDTREKLPITDLSLMLQGFHTISRIANSQKEKVASPDYDSSISLRIKDLLTALTTYHTLASSNRDLATEDQLISWENQMQYVADIPESHFFGNQRRGLRVAKRAALKTSLQPQHINTYLHVLEKYISSLENNLIDQQPSDGQSSTPTKNIWLHGATDIEIRRKLFPLIFHDLNGATNTVQLWQEIQEFQDNPQLLRSNSGLGLAWENLSHTTSHLTRLIEQPYIRHLKPTQYWQEQLQEAAKSLSSKYPDLEVRQTSTASYGQTVWSEEWLRSLVSNVGQNAMRAWTDAINLQFDQTKSPFAHPVLEITTQSSPIDFAITFQDNCTGFSEEYLRNGFSGQHGYRSHKNTTGTAMKTLSRMIRVYDGETILANRYQEEDGTIIDSAEPALLYDPRYKIIGGSVKITLPLKAR